jgi:hypothetical protein
MRLNYILSSFGKEKVMRKLKGIIVCGHVHL